MHTVTIAVDLAKNVFELAVANQNNHIVERRRLADGVRRENIADMAERSVRRREHAGNPHDRWRSGATIGAR